MKVEETKINQSCPPPEKLASLLDEDVKEDTCAELKSHLSNCKECRQALDDLAVHSEWWGPRREILRDLQEYAPIVKDAPRAANQPTGKPQTTDGATRTKTEIPYQEAIGPWQIENEIGRGGMGIVYKAHDSRLERVVALKVIRFANADAEQLQRIQREAKTLGRLNHPNIVQIYEVGKFEDTPWLALEYVDGMNLAEYLDHTPQPAKSSAEFVETLARAIHVAHEAGIVHRDLKPANVLRDEGRGANTRGEGLLAAIPKITDFGLAKRIDSEEQLTRSGVAAGTPCYMAPEQAGTRSETIGPATDVYALGAILYEMLTGRPPFKGETAVQTLQQVIYDEPISPRSFQKDLPTDLATICMKCLEKDSARRYGSALELAEDLRRFRSDEPILARPPGMVGRLLRWSKRRPSIAALIAVSLLAFVAIVAGSVLYAWEKHDRQLQVADERDKFKRQRDRAIGLEKLANANAERAKAATKKTEIALGKVSTEKLRYQKLFHRSRLKTYALNMLLAQRDLSAKNYVPAADKLRDAPIELRGWEYAYLTSLVKNKMPHVFRLNGRGAVVAYSPDGKWLAIGASVRNRRDPKENAVVQIWDLTDRKMIRSIKAHNADIHRILWNADATRVITLGGRQSYTIRGPNGEWPNPFGEMCIWDVGTGRRLGHLETKLTLPIQFALSADGNRLATVFRGGAIAIWNLQTGKTFRTIPTAGIRVDRIALSPDGTLLAIGVYERDGKICTLRLLDVASGAELYRDEQPSGGLVRFAQFSPKRPLLIYAIGRNEATFKVVNLDSKMLQRSFTAKGLAVLSNFRAQWIGDGSQVLFRNDEHLAILNAVTGAANWQTNHERRLTGAATSVDGRLLAFAKENNVTVVDIDPIRNAGNAKKRIVDRIDGHSAGISDLAFRPDGDQLAVGDGEGIVRVWNLEPVAKQSVIKWVTTPRNRNTQHIVASANGRSLLIEDGNRRIRLIDTETGAQQFALAHWRLHFLREISNDGKRFAWIGWDREKNLKLNTWDAVLGYRALRTHSPMMRMTFSSDGEWLALGDHDVVRILDYQSGEDVATFRRRKGKRFVGMGFSRNGKCIAINDVAEKLDGQSIVATRLWDLETAALWKELHFQSGRSHFKTKWQTVFNADGSLVAAVAVPKRGVINDRSTVTILKCETGEIVTKLQSTSKPLHGMRFAPNGRRFCVIQRPFGTASKAEIVFWDIATGQQIFVLPTPYHEICGIGFSASGRILTVTGN